ncbi:MAG: GNAT family N-acetyltransferase, partial [Oscillospiraceae bacterium]|nr:GNAT family N-acetyltransferase [Oscillospiraceae bacterium]
MKIHMLDSDEKYRAAKISLLAFHIRSDEPEKQLRRWMCGDTEDWGAFTDDDVLMARAVNNSLSMKLYGSCVKCGGVGAVSTLPEYRGNGAVRA